MKLTFKTTPVFEANRNAKAKVVVNQGGTSSSKTYSIIQLLFIIAIESSCVITVAGQDIPNLKKGALRDALTIYHNTPGLKNFVSNYNKSDRIFEFYNGSIIEFNSYADEQDAKSGKRDYLFINEANGVKWEVYWQLYIRTRKQIFIDYNPSAKFWVHDNLIGKPGVQLIISDHRHNPFLSEEEHEKIESISDREYWKVYARGLTGKIEGLLLPESDLKFANLHNYDLSQAIWRVAVGDPADKGGDYYAMPFAYIMPDFDVIIKEVICSKDGIDVNTERIIEKSKSNEIEQVIIEANGGWVSSVKLVKDGLSDTDIKVTAYKNTINKLIRILANYEFIKDHFVFDENYKNNDEYKTFMRIVTTFLKEGKNENDDPVDVLAALANVVKVKFKAALYGQNR